jgi:hypothetical protein
MIVGAGLAGLIAAYVFPDQAVFEVHSRDWVEHQALLRFRSPAIADLTGIPFRAVTVNKGIWDRGWVSPNIASCNRYSRKVAGRVNDRSIWDISTVTRWIAPPDLHSRLAAAVGDRVRWNSQVLREDMFAAGMAGELVISTIPLPVLASAFGHSPELFSRSAIFTTHSVVPGADVFQSVYFPSPLHSLYRASITGDKLLMEWMPEVMTERQMKAAAEDVAFAFGLPELSDHVLESLSSMHTQSYGKISPIDESLRRGLVLRLTQEKKVYSLGRFATWCNILLDDVVHDAAVIKRLVYEADNYERALGAY